MRRITGKIKMFAVLVCICLATGGTVPASAASAGGYRAVFDADYYYQAYPDLQAAFGKDSAKLYRHFMTFGIKEGRSGCADFNIDVYRANNPDLVKAFGGDLEAYCNHYAVYGKAEGRIASDGTQPAAAASQQETAGTVISSYTTYYETGVPRALNIQVAVSRLNGTVVQPGTEFSFSSTILPRTTANGYVLGPAYSNGEVIQSVGGGICQVSSTLYAAMLTGSVPASERHAHSMPVAYLPEGMDATISGNWLDLKFVNQQAYPILIQASASGGALTVTLLRL